MESINFNLQFLCCCNIGCDNAGFHSSSTRPILPLEESMETEELPFYKRLSFKFLFSTAVFLLLIEAILMVFSVFGMQARLLEIRQYVVDALPSSLSDLRSNILTQKEINVILQQYIQNIALMVVVILTVVCGGLYFVVYHWFLKPIHNILQANSEIQRGKIALIDGDEIPDNELGILIRSRNRMLETLNTIYNNEALETLCQAVDAKDRYTVGHSRRVGMIGQLLGKHLDFEYQECQKLDHAGTLHDIGKIGVPDQILKKDGKLTDEEFEEIKKHPTIGAQMIRFSTTPDQVLEGIEYHHERFDGTGYPDGLKGEEIPLYGRILGVADAMDAMLSTRSYREAKDLEEAMQELEQYKATQFDADIAEIGITLLKESYAEDQDFLEVYLPSQTVN